MKPPILKINDNIDIARQGRLQPSLQISHYTGYEIPNDWTNTDVKSGMRLLTPSRDIIG